MLWASGAATEKKTMNMATTAFLQASAPQQNGAPVKAKTLELFHPNSAPVSQAQ